MKVTTAIRQPARTIINRPRRSDSHPNTTKNGNTSTRCAERAGANVNGAQGDEQERQEEPDSGRRLDEARRVAPAVGAGVLRHIGCGSTILATERKSLHQAERHE